MNSVWICCSARRGAPPANLRAVRLLAGGAGALGASGGSREGRPASHAGVEDARKRAEASRWRLETGRVLNGREYVDFCIAEGFSEIVDMARGRARAYRICNPRHGVSRPLRAKDGTLSYARARLAQAGVPQ